MMRDLEEWELDMIAGGDGTPEMEAALAGNPRNRARLADRGEVERAMRAHLFRALCPPVLALGEWKLGLLDRAAQARVEAHLTECPHCQGELPALEALLEQPIPRTHGATALRRIIMTLQNQLGGAPRMAAQPALRGEGWSAFYGSGDFLISLTRQSRGEVVLLSGTVLGPDPSGQALLRQGEATLYHAPLSTHATFTFLAVRPGIYELAVVTPEAELVIPHLSVEH